MTGAWMMRMGFAGYGLGVALAMAWAGGLVRLERTALVSFGLGMIAAALWSHAPVLPDLPADWAEDQAHSVASAWVGASFALACAARLFAAKGPRRDALAALGLVVSVAIPLAMIAWPGVQGLSQRAMFLFSAAYLWHRLQGAA